MSRGLWLQDYICAIYLYIHVDINIAHSIHLGMKAVECSPETFHCAKKHLICPLLNCNLTKNDSVLSIFDMVFLSVWVSLFVTCFLGGIFSIIQFTCNMDVSVKGQYNFLGWYLYLGFYKKMCTCSNVKKQYYFSLHLPGYTICLKHHVSGSVFFLCGSRGCWCKSNVLWKCVPALRC